MGDWKLITFNMVFLAGAYFIKASIRVAICFYAVWGNTSGEYTCISNLYDGLHC